MCRFFCGSPNRENEVHLFTGAPPYHSFPTSFQTSPRKMLSVASGPVSCARVIDRQLGRDQPTEAFIERIRETLAVPIWNDIQVHRSDNRTFFLEDGGAYVFKRISNKEKDLRLRLTIMLDFPERTYFLDDVLVLPKDSPKEFLQAIEEQVRFTMPKTGKCNLTQATPRQPGQVAFIKHPGRVHFSNLLRWSSS
jgi:hypothetical protein